MFPPRNVVAHQVEQLEHPVLTAQHLVLPGAPSQRAAERAAGHRAGLGVCGAVTALPRRGTRSRLRARDTGQPLGLAGLGEYPGSPRASRGRAGCAPCRVSTSAGLHPHPCHHPLLTACPRLSPPGCSSTACSRVFCHTTHSEQPRDAAQGAPWSSTLPGTLGAREQRLTPPFRPAPPLTVCRQLLGPVLPVPAGTAGTKQQQQPRGFAFLPVSVLPGQAVTSALR